MSPSSESVAAARDLVLTIRAADQFKAVLPRVLQNLKADIARNQPEIEKQFEALSPALTAAANEHINDLAEQLAEIYARHFNADEIRQIIAFCRTPVGQSFIAQQTYIAHDVMTTGDQFVRTLTSDLRTRALEALRKQGNGN